MKVIINRVEGQHSSYYWIEQYMSSPNAIYAVHKIEPKAIDIDEKYLLSKDLEDLAYRAYYGEI